MLELQPTSGRVGWSLSDDPCVDDAALLACRRLAAEFPTVTLHEIARLVRLALDNTAHASVQGFRVVLAERAARARLHALSVG